MAINKRTIQGSIKNTDNEIKRVEIYKLNKLYKTENF